MRRVFNFFSYAPYLIHTAIYKEQYINKPSCITVSMTVSVYSCIFVVNTALFDLNHIFTFIYRQ